MSCTSIIDYEITQDLSGEDILSLTKKNPVTYDKLSKYKNIDDLLGQEKFAIILYLTSSKTEGHWTCVYRQSYDNKIVFFDSYGFEPDTEDQYAAVNSKLPRYLTNLLQKSGEHYTWNQVDYQVENSKVANCGRYASCAAMCFRHMNLEQVNSFLKKNDSAWLSSDRIVTLLTVFTLKQIQDYFSTS